MDGIPRMKRLQGMDRLSQLPDDVLWMILGFLDLRSLYTARLVCKSFRKSAAGHFKAMHCTTLEELPTTDLTQFSGTTYFTVTVSPKSHVQSLAHPRIAPFITHVSLKGFHFRDSQTAEELEAALRRLPKLRSVSLEPLKGASCLPLFPASLEELKLPDPPYRAMYWREQWEGLGDTSPLTRYSQLTSLAINLVRGAETSMGCLSSLRNLRSLDLCGCPSAIGVLSTFSTFTSLTFEQSDPGSVGSIFQELGRLTGLSRLALSMAMAALDELVVTDEDLTCIAQLTNLTCLDMRGCTLADSVASSTALVALTRLVSMCFNNGCIHGWVPRPQISLPQLAALQSLGLGDASDVLILGQATGLTHLGLSCEIEELDFASLQEFRPAVAGMSMLRSLEISVTIDQWEDDDDVPDDWTVICLARVLPACPMLTKLACSGNLHPDRPERDLEACASLSGLRSLSLARSLDLTPHCLPALQAMTGLTELSLDYTGICAADMTPDVIAAFDAERRRWG